MSERRFLLVDADVLPEVFGKVLQAKELLASGAAPNISGSCPPGWYFPQCFL